MSGRYKKAYDQGYEDAKHGASKLACPYGCIVGQFGLRTAWIAGYNQYHDEQGAANEAA